MNFSVYRNNNNDNSQRSKITTSTLRMTFSERIQTHPGKITCTHGVCPNQNRISRAARFARLSRSRAYSVANRQMELMKRSSSRRATFPRCQRGKHARFSTWRRHAYRASIHVGSFFFRKQRGMCVCVPSRRRRSVREKKSNTSRKPRIFHGLVEKLRRRD